ncbi:uncharacterized protein LOC134837637 [Culicoides brevitarsis]|uniref:uncharacterized protein LOC134837637 n=1 Tax=Culicoides brevitarsis TaxID=469753 RepID=UPI00307C5746
MGNNDSKQPEKPVEKSPLRVPATNQPKFLEFFEAKQQAIQYIRQRISNKGMKDFFALEILENVIPDAKYTLDPLERNPKYVFSWKSCVVTAQSIHSKDEDINCGLFAKRKVASAAMMHMFNIALPVYEPPTSDDLYKKYEKYFQYEIFSQKWKVTFSLENKTMSAFGSSKKEAHDAIWTEDLKNFLYERDSRPIKDTCRKTFISLAISETSSLEKRIEFVLKNLTTEENHLKLTDGVLSVIERNKMQKLLDSMRTFNVLLAKTDVEEYVACLNLDGRDMFRVKNSLLDAKMSLILAAMEISLREMTDNVVSKIADNVVLSFMRMQYADKSDKKSVEVLKKEAFEHAKRLLEENDLKNNDAMTILHKTLNYVCFSETIFDSSVRATILWRGWKFEGIGVDELSAATKAAIIALEKLFGLSLKFYELDKEAKRKELESKIKHTTKGVAPTVNYISRIDIDGETLSTISRNLNDGKKELLEKALKHIFRKNVQNTIEENRKSLVRALVKKEDPLIDRIRFVFECMRTKNDPSTPFYATDDVLDESEKTQLLFFEKAINTHKRHDHLFEASINLNDEFIRSKPSMKEFHAKNEVILAAYEVFDKILAKNALKKDNSTVCAEKNSKSETKSDQLELYKDRFLKEYSENDPRLQYPSIIWFKITLSQIPIDTIVDEKRNFVSTIKYYGKIFTESSSDRDKSRQKVACRAMKELFNVNYRIWDEILGDSSKIIHCTSNQITSNGTDKTKEKQVEMNLCKNRAQNHLKSIKYKIENVQPTEVWSMATAPKYLIQTTNTSKGFISEIQFFDEKFSVKNENKKESRQKVAALACKEILGIHLPHWNKVTKKQEDLKNVEKLRLEATKIYYNRAKEMLNSTTKNLAADKFWQKLVGDKHPIEVEQTPQGAFLATIEFYGKKIKEENMDEAKSRTKVSETALDKLLGIILPQQNYEKKKVVEEKTSEEEIAAIKVYEERLKKSLLYKNLKPSQLWNNSTMGHYPFETIESGKGFKSTIVFFGKTFSAEHSNQHESRHEVAKIAIKNIFGISPSEYLTKQENSEQRIAAIKKLEPRLKEFLSPNMYNQKYWTPLNLWHGLTQPSFPILTKPVNGGFSSRLHFHDKTFTAEHSDEKESRHEVAKMALINLFGVCLPTNNSDKDKNQKIEKIQISDEKNQISAENKSEQRISAVKKLEPRLKDFLSPNYDQKSWNPGKLWHALTQPDYQIITKKSNAGYTSTIIFHDKTFSVENQDESYSRQGVALTALRELFGISVSKWSYFEPKVVQSSSSSRSSSVSSVARSERRNSDATEKAEKLRYLSKRATDILSNRNKNIQVNPVDLWNSITESKYPIKTEKSGDRIVSQILFYDRTYSDVDANEKKSKNKVAVRALSALFGIYFQYWAEYSSSKKTQVVTSALPSAIPTKNELKEPSTDKNDEKSEEKAPEEEVPQIIPSNKNKISPEKKMEILDELKSIAREIIDNNEEVSDPTQLWNETVKSHLEYKIMTEFHSKKKKYVSTIEFHDQIFVNEDWDEMKAETGVACKALDELLELDFNEEDENTKSRIEENEEKLEETEVQETFEASSEFKIKELTEKLEEIQVQETFKASSEAKIEKISEKLEETKIEETFEAPSEASESKNFEDIIFYEPLIKRIQAVLTNLSPHYIRSSYLIFKHSSSPVLTNDEWQLLKEIDSKIFPVTIDPSLSDVVTGFQMSVIVNEHNVFGEGSTEKEARDATIVAAFEHIEKIGLIIGTDDIEIEKNSVQEDETGKKSCLQKLKDYHKQLLEQKLSLDDVPCAEIFQKIGIKFKFEYETDDPDLDHVKEITSRFAVKKLMDKAYALDY